MRIVKGAVIMDFKNLVNQVCMLTGMTGQAGSIFLAAGYIELEVNGVNIFYLQEDKFYGYIVNPQTEEKKIYNLKTPLDFSNMLYDLNLIIDKGESPDAKFLFMFRKPEYYMTDFTIVDLETKETLRKMLWDNDEGETLFEIELDSDSYFSSNIYVEVSSENFFIRRISPSEAKALTEVFGGSLSNICENFFEYIRDYQEE